MARTTFPGDLASKVHLIITLYNTHAKSILPSFNLNFSTEQFLVEMMQMGVMCMEEGPLMINSL